MREEFSFPQQNQPERPPQIKIPTEDVATHEKKDRVLSSISHNAIKTPEGMIGRERHEAFESAYNKIVGNEQLERLAIRAIKGERSAFPEITNRMTELCLTLSEEEIDSVVRKFHETLRSKVDVYTRKYELNSQEILHLKNGVRMVQEKRRDFLNPIGIKSVARFVRSRLRLHSEKPETIPAFYFENYLDAEHNIDLIEMFDQPEGIVMNLIQIKSREYSPQDIEKNTEIHKRWVNDYAVDLGAYEKSFEVEPTDSERYKEFFGEVSHVEDLLMEMLIGETITVDILFEKLGLKGVPHVERMWILSTYIDSIKEAITHVGDVGLTEDQMAHIQKVVSSIDSKLQVIRNQKKDLKGVSEVHSICTVADKIVSDTVIFKAKGSDRKAVYIKR